MKKLLLLFLAIKFCNLAFGQGAFNYQKDFKNILAKTKDRKSNLYRPILLERFINNDSTLTNHEVLALMIGFTEDENYQPYKTIEKERQILELISNKNYNEALSKSDSLLRTNPLNFIALMEKGFAHWKLGHGNLDYHKSRYFKIQDAIRYSGNGSLENPYFVLSPIDGQIIIRYVWQGSIGIMGSGSDPNGNFLDILEMKKEGKEPKTYYFIIQHALNKSDQKAQVEEAIRNLKNKK